MAAYSYEDKQRLLSIPIVSVLEHFGRRTDHYRGMYYSPFREERYPSMHIDATLNLWNDFGADIGGNVLHMVSRLSGEPLSRSWDILAGISPASISGLELIPVREQSRGNRISVDSVGTRFTSGKLISYARSRGISEDLLNRYCCQISYHVGDSVSPHHTSIGFPAADGWVLRSAREGFGAKLCTSCRPTFIGKGGDFTSAIQSPCVEVFEGFFDFLSWMELSGRLVPESDVCVLNSVNNLCRSVDYLKGHESVSCWLDNDQAGRKAQLSIAGFCPQAVSRSAEMSGCKDLNEYLVSRKESMAKDNTVSTKSTLKNQSHVYKSD